MRIDPPPSFACAIGSAPAATSAADPPDDAPQENSVFHGLRVGGLSTNSVVAVSPNAGKVDAPTMFTPVETSCSRSGSVVDAGVSGVAAEPLRVGIPAKSVLFLTIEGTPANDAAPKSVSTARLRARSRSSKATALSVAFTASMRSSAASTASTAEISPAAMAAPTPTPSSSPSASSRKACTCCMARSLAVPDGRQDRISSQPLADSPDPDSPDPAHRTMAMTSAARSVAYSSSIGSANTAWW